MFPHIHAYNLCKKTIAGRCFLVGLCVLAQPAQAQPLSVDAVVQQGLSRPALEALREDIEAEGQLSAEEAALWDNPELLYEYQHTFGGDAGSLQNLVMLSQRFELSGTRDTRAEAARMHSRAQGERLLGRLLDREAHLELRFYRVLHAQSRVEALQAWASALDDALVIVARREEAGDLSRFERVRLESEITRAQGRIEQARIDRNTRWAELEALAGDLADDNAPWPRVQGELLPPAPSLEDGVLESDPELRAMASERQAAALEAEAAEASWIPALTVGVGYLHQGSAGDNAHGLGVELSMPLTLLNTGQTAADAARARERIVESEHTLTREQLTGELAAARLEAQQRRELAQSFGTEVARGDEVVQIAEAGYAGAELLISELLDAHSHRVDLVLDALDYRWQARRADLTLHALLSRRGVSLD